MHCPPWSAETGAGPLGLPGPDPQARRERNAVRLPRPARPLSRSIAVGLALPLLLAPATGATAAPSASDDGLLGRQDPVSSDPAVSYSVGAFPQSLALLGVAAGGAGSTPAAKAAVAWLVRQQCDDGGWQYYRADLTKPCTPPDPATYSGEDTNSTAVAVEALAALGASPRVDPIQFLRGGQNADGGFGYVPGAGTDPDSTGLVMQAFAARGLDPAGVRSSSGKSPYDAVLGYQLGCSAPAADRGGFYAFDPASPDALATAQALPGLVDKPYPLRGLTVSSTSPSPTCPAGAKPKSAATLKAARSAASGAAVARDATPGRHRKAVKAGRRAAGVTPQTGAGYGATWLASQINARGYIDGPGGPAYGLTAYAALGIAATETNKAAVTRAAGYLAASVDPAVRDDHGLDRVGNLGLLALVAAATDTDAGKLAARILANCTGTCSAAPSPTPSPTASTPVASTAPTAQPSSTPTGPDLPETAELPTDNRTLPFTGSQTGLTLLAAAALVCAGIGARRAGKRRGRAAGRPAATDPAVRR